MGKTEKNFVAVLLLGNFTLGMMVERFRYVGFLGMADYAGSMYLFGFGFLCFLVSCWYLLRG